jgi:hypothetical protein
MLSELDLDGRILAFAAAHRSDFLDLVFRGTTWLGSLYVLLPITIAAILRLARRQ